MRHTYTQPLATFPAFFCLGKRNPRGSRRKALGGRVQALSGVIHGVGRQSGSRRETLWKTPSPRPGHIADMTSPLPSPVHIADMHSPNPGHIADMTSPHPARAGDRP